MSTIHEATCDHCGFTTRNEHRSYVDRALRVHSCEKWIEKAAKAERRTQREAAVDRTPKPCHHKQTTHEHGTHACYVLDRCRCHPCTKATAQYENHRTRQIAYGRWNPLVDAEPARQHIRSLMAAGMGLKQISKRPGVSQGGLWKLIYGKRQADGTQVPSKRIRREVEAAILAVDLELADGAVVDGTGTRRRLRALVAIGYPIARLSRELGITNLWRTVVNDDLLVQKSTADATVELYDRLAMTVNQPERHADKVAATRARNLARSRGWLPPLAWDDERIDDPTHQPLPDHNLVDHEHDEAVVLRRLNGDRTGRLTKADRIEIVRRAREAGWSLLDIDRRAGITKPERYLPTPTTTATTPVVVGTRPAADAEGEAARQPATTHDQGDTAA